MNRKNKIAVVAVMALVVLAAPFVAFASPAFQERAAIAYPYPAYPNYDWPYLLAFKGVAVSEDSTLPAALVVLGEDKAFGDGFKNMHLILGEESVSLKAEDVEVDERRGVIVIRTADARIVVKIHDVNYQRTAFASGTYKDWQLNMVLVNAANDFGPIYTIMEETPRDIKTFPETEPGVIPKTVSAEETVIGIVE